MTPPPRLSDFDAQARLACRRLEALFGARSHPEHALGAPRPSLGAEIEIPWSGYFPELWERFGLARGFSALSLEERLALSEACSEQEALLRPRLERAAACGVPRGNDRYWEFAFDPVCDWRWLDREIELLEGSGLLPNNGARSFQLTVGGMRQGPDAQALARGLEALASNPSRLAAGLESAKSIIHTGWARKGSGGVHEKGSGELKGGAPWACEFRTLLLPQEADRRRQTLAMASLGALAIERSASAPQSPLAQAWAGWRQECEAALRERGADDLAWSDPRSINRVSWASYIAEFEDLAPWLIERWRSRFEGLDALAWPGGEPRARSAPSAG